VISSTWRTLRPGDDVQCSCFSGGTHPGENGSPNAAGGTGIVCDDQLKRCTPTRPAVPPCPAPPVTTRTSERKTPAPPGRSHNPPQHRKNSFPHGKNPLQRCPTSGGTPPEPLGTRLRRSSHVPSGFRTVRIHFLHVRNAAVLHESAGDTPQRLRSGDISFRRCPRTFRRCPLRASPCPTRRSIRPHRILRRKNRHQRCKKSLGTAQERILTSKVLSQIAKHQWFQKKGLQNA
jgi:hypothetical protein